MPKPANASFFKDSQECSSQGLSNDFIRSALREGFLVELPKTEAVRVSARQEDLSSNTGRVETKVPVSRGNMARFSCVAERSLRGRSVALESPRHDSRKEPVLSSTCTNFNPHKECAILKWIRYCTSNASTFDGTKKVSKFSDTQEQ